MIELRRATAEDAGLLARTRRIVWEETYRGIYPDSMLDDYDVQAYTLRDRKRIEDPEHHFYLFFDDGVCIGYFSFGPYNHGIYKDFDLCLNNLYILRQYKGRGLGSVAFEVLRRYCAERGIRKFFCGCHVRNLPARSFYEHMGGIPGDAPVPDDIIHYEFCAEVLP